MIKNSLINSGFNMATYMVEDAICQTKQFKAASSWIKEIRPVKAIANHVESFNVPFGELAKGFVVLLFNYRRG